MLTADLQKSHRSAIDVPIGFGIIIMIGQLMQIQMDVTT